MASRLKHPAVMAALTCAAVAVAYLPPSARVPRGRIPARADSIDVGSLHVAQLRNEKARAAQTLTLLRTRDRFLTTWRHHGQDRFWVSDPDTSGTGERSLAAALDSLWRRLPQVDSAVRVGIAVRRVRPSGLDWSHSQVWVLAPEATDGRSCIVLASLPRRISAVDWVTRLDGGTRLLGYCAFYGSFGMPGPRIARWLAHGAIRFGFSPDLDSAAYTPVEQPHSLLATAFRGFDLPACRLGDTAQCTKWMLTSTPRYDGIWLDRSELPMSVWWGAWEVNAPEITLFGDLLRTFGPERFAQFWHADARPDSAFAAAFGVPMGTWVQAWAARAIGPVPHHEHLPTGSMVVSLGCVILLVGAGVEVSRHRTVA